MYSSTLETEAAVLHWNLRLNDRKEPYNLGEGEFHLAFTVDDFGKMYEKHKAMGVICFENKEMGVYFIADPDGYWIEIVPEEERQNIC